MAGSVKVRRCWCWGVGKQFECLAWTDNRLKDRWPSRRSVVDISVSCQSCFDHGSQSFESRQAICQPVSPFRVPQSTISLQSPRPYSLPRKACRKKVEEVGSRDIVGHHSGPSVLGNYRSTTCVPEDQIAKPCLPSTPMQ